VLADARHLEWAGRFAVWAKRTGIADAAEKMKLPKMADRRLAGMSEVMPAISAPPFRRGRREAGADPARARMKVGYFVSCGLSFAFPEVVDATLRVLGRAGCAVTILDNTCCGRPAAAYGDVEAARDIARRNVDRLSGVLGDVDAVVSECGSCSTHLKDYEKLLASDPDYAPTAAALSHKTRSFSELLATVGLGDRLRDVEGTVTWHDPCHLSNRFAKVTAQPRSLLKSVPKLTFKEMPEADWCCGAAGSYTFLHHGEATKVLERKMGNVAKTNATILATECPSCLMHLAFGVRRQGLDMQVQHLSQILDRATAEA
jgi:glycolate oxidase iron-sulfur subunit